MASEIRVPALGESVSEATVAKWLKNVGDAVALDEPLVELETDKVTLEVNAQAAGNLAEIAAPVGSNVEVGGLLGRIGDGAGTAKPAAKPAAPVPAAAAKPAQPAPKPAAAAAAQQTLSPAVRKIVEEKQLDVSKVTGTGKDGRLTKGDVLTQIE